MTLIAVLKLNMALNSSSPVIPVDQLILMSSHISRWMHSIYIQSTGAQPRSPRRPKMRHQKSLRMPTKRKKTSRIPLKLRRSSQQVIHMFHIQYLVTDQLMKNCLGLNWTMVYGCCIPASHFATHLNPLKPAGVDTLRFV